MRTGRGLTTLCVLLGVASWVTGCAGDRAAPTADDVVVPDVTGDDTADGAAIDPEDVGGDPGDVGGDPGDGGGELGDAASDVDTATEGTDADGAADTGAGATTRGGSSAGRTRADRSLGS